MRQTRGRTCNSPLMLRSLSLSSADLLALLSPLMLRSLSLSSADLLALLSPLMLRSLSLSSADLLALLSPLMLRSLSLSSADLLALLSRRESVIVELLHLNGMGRVVGQLQTGDLHLTQVCGGRGRQRGTLIFDCR